MVIVLTGIQMEHGFNCPATCHMPLSSLFFSFLYKCTSFKVATTVLNYFLVDATDETTSHVKSGLTGLIENGTNQESL